MLAKNQLKFISHWVKKELGYNKIILADLRGGAIPVIMAGHPNISTKILWEPIRLGGELTRLTQIMSIGRNEGKEQNETGENKNREIGGWQI